MFIVLLVIALLIIWLGALANRHDWFDGIGCFVSGGVIAVLTALAIVLCGTLYSNKITIDDRMALYTETNAQIEQQIGDIVNAYQEYESETFASLKLDSAIAIAQTYPALVSNAVVQQQVSLYVSNNENIRALRSEKIRYRVLAWWLFFGKE